MSLIDSANSLKTDWKPFILQLLSKHPEIEQYYQDECSKFKDTLSIYPKPEHIFRCFDYFDTDDTKIVILGQDPYHGPDQAIGLCFGVPKNVKVPPSLKNIIKKLKSELGSTAAAESPSLEHWARQGILMLNTALTVRHKTPLSHMKKWMPFTKAVIKYLKTHGKNIVFVAWGAFAHGILADVGKDHHLIVSSHPSPLSFSRKYKIYPSFKDAEIFAAINKLVEVPIDW